MQKKIVLRIIFLALIVIWMLSTFELSDQNGEDSSNLSREVASKLTSDEEKVDVIEPYVRKLAHFTEYTVGGILFCALFLTYPFSDKKRMVCSLALGIEYAAIDEIHQLFIDGRSGQITDVLIDTIGISFGICILMLLYKIFYQRKGALEDRQESS